METMDAGSRSGEGQRNEKLEAAFARHREMLLQWAHLHLGPRRDDADDFLQDVFERFLVTFPDGPPPELHCGSWLIVVLSRLVIIEWRKQDVRRRNQSDPTLRVVSASQQAGVLDSSLDPSTLETLLETLTSEAFQSAVRSLSPKLRETYELHMLELSHGQIAARLGISSVAVRKRLHDARKQLRERLKLGLSEEAP
jgi:RNA polymerase sigma-70 factor, ECF subfamily